MTARSNGVNRFAESFGLVRAILNGEVIAMCSVILIIFIAWGLVNPVLPLYLKTLGATGTLIGLAMAVYGVGEGIFGFVWGSLSDRIGITIPLGVQAFGGVVILIAFALVPVLGVVFVLRFLMAAAGSAIWSTGRGYLAYAVPPGNKGLAMALFALLVSGGMSIGGFGSGALVDRLGFAYTFLIAAALLFIAGVVVVSKLQGVRIVRAAIEGSDAASAASPKQEPGASIRPMLILATLITLIFIVFSSSSTFLPLLITDVMGFAPTDVGINFGFTGLVSLFFLIPLGRLSDRLGRKPVLLGGITVMLLALLGMAYLRSLPLILLSTIMMSIGRWACDPPILALVSDITPLQLQGRAQGIFVIASDLGIVLGPVMTGIIWDRAGATPSYLFCAAVAIVAFLMTLILVRDKEWLARRSA